MVLAGLNTHVRQLVPCRVPAEQLCSVFTSGPPASPGLDSVLPARLFVSHLLGHCLSLPDVQGPENASLHPWRVTFVGVSGGRVNLVPGDPFWPEMEVGCFLFKSKLWSQQTFFLVFLFSLSKFFVTFAALNRQQFLGLNCKFGFLAR